MNLLADRRADIEVGRFDFRSNALSAEIIERSLLRARVASPERAVLLIHGWAVPVERQAESYDSLLRLIDARHPPAADAILTVSWRSTGPYWDVVVDTPAIAAALASLLRSSERPFARMRELVLIGHSMGCRVALELAENFRASGGFAPGIRLFLMAAAVPVPKVEPPSGELALAARASDHSVVYYSPEDLALGAVFRAGQTAALDGGFLPEAVGHWGRPEKGVWRDRQLMVGFEHGHYWRSDHIALDLVTDHLRLLERSTPMRDLPGRVLAQRTI